MKKTPLKMLLALALCLPLLITTARAQPTAPTNPNDVAPLKIGLKLPEITLADSTGATYELTKSLSNGPAILVFYRGGWCPFCNAQLSELGKIEPDLLKLGYRIFAISPDSPTELAKTSAKHKLNYKLLSDSKMKASSALGLSFKLDDETVQKYKGYGIDLEKNSGETHHLLPVPAVYIVGTDGVVDFSYVNPDYKTRVPGDLLLAAAKIFATPTKQ